jgi:hypothetical protein
MPRPEEKGAMARALDEPVNELEFFLWTDEQT